MVYETSERAGVEEQYQVAGNTSDLTVEADRRGAGDMMIAAGWSESRIGMALLRLHSEWGGLAKPRRASKEVFEVIVARNKAQDASASAKGLPRAHGTPVQRAQAEIDRWYASELRLLANGLKARALVWEQLLPWVLQHGMSTEAAAEALLYWLDPTCPKCDGHGLLKLPDAPSLSTKRCPKCYGAGKLPHPEGTGKLLGHLDYCVSVARGSLKKRLRPQG